MLEIASVQGGLCKQLAPDVCLVKAIPVPFPNVAFLAETEGACETVLIRMAATVVLTSEIPDSIGDEPGKDGGVISGKNEKECKFTTASSKVFAGGKPVVLLNSATTQNKANTIGSVNVVANTTVFAVP